MSEQRLLMRRMVKAYGGVRALDGVDFELRPGEVHGLIGENGAGKSTLIRCAAGTVIPDAGQIFVSGRAVEIRSPKDSLAAGIAVVHQEAELFGHLSLAENMLLGTGLPRHATGFIDWRSTYTLADECLKRLGERMDVRQPAAHLSVAQRMIAGIAAAIHHQASVLFLDEPSASLTRREVEMLFEHVRRLRGIGVSVVFVSHRLEEVRQLCDRVTVMRDGRRIWTRDAAEVNTDMMVSAMVGRAVEMGRRRVNRGTDAVALAVAGLTDAHGRFRDIAFELRRGEVLGVYGLVGAGRTEIAHALFGLRDASGGRIELNGSRYRPCSPGAAVRAGIAYVPEDRLVQGVFGRLAVRFNAGVTALQRWSTLGLISPRQVRERSRATLDSMRVKMASPEQPIRTLSGGNQQKVVLGRWLLTDPRVLILDEPTRGVDVGAKSEIHALIDQLAASGQAVLLISSDLPEVMQTSDRVMVLRQGRIAGWFDPDQHTAEQLAAAALPDVENAENSPIRTPHASAGSGPALACGVRIDTRKSAIRNPQFAIREFGLLAALILLIIAMSIARPDSFFSISKALDIAQYASILSLLAIGATLVIAAGGIDISVGSMLGLIAVIAGQMAERGSGSIPILLASIAIGVCLGAANAGASLIGRVHPIIVTLAGLSIYRGLALWIQEKEIVTLPPALRQIGHGTWGALPSFRLGPAGIEFNEWVGVPKTVWFAAAVAVATGVFLRRTQTGRQLLAVGDSIAAADLIGLPRRRLQLLAFGLSGALVGLAAVLTAAYEGAVLPNGTGAGRELQAIAAAVIGGAAITGGRGSALGTVTGTLLIATIYSSLVLLGIPSHWNDLAIGAMILTAVILDAALRREE